MKQIGDDGTIMVTYNFIHQLWHEKVKSEK